MRKHIILITVSVFFVAVFSVIFSYQYKKAEETHFQEDGYILNNELSENEKQLLFSTGTDYKDKLPDFVTFSLKNGEMATVPRDSFIHYNSGSVSALTSGVFIDLADFVSTDYVNHYSAESGLTFTKDMDGYLINNSTDKKVYQRILWKLSERKYIILADKLTLNFSDADEREVENYVEVTQLDEGVLQLQTEENVWMTMSESCYCTLGNGVRLHLSNQTVEDDTTILLYLSQLVADSAGNIPVLTEDWNRRTPLFKVDSKDGEEGEIGAHGATGIPGTEGLEGDEGILGENGDKGKQGTEGTQGNKGKLGDQGTGGNLGTAGISGIAGMDGKLGEHGVEGNRGIAGNAGSSGSQGSSGSAGATGATGFNGLGGNASIGEDGNVTDDPQPPSASITQFSLTASSITATISIQDPNTMLEDDSGEIYIINMGTNQVIDLNEGKLEENRFRIGAALSGYTLNYEGLDPDTQYRLVVNGNYVYGSNLYTKEFINRSFYTDSTGVIVTKQYAEEDNLHFMIAKYGNDDNIDSLRLYLFEAPHGRYDFSNEVKNDAVMLAEITNTEISNNTTINMKIKNTKQQAEDLENNTEYVLRYEIVDRFGNALLSKDVITSFTLKKKPTVGKPLIIENRSDRSFEIYPGSLTDPDNSIIGYRFDLYDAILGTKIKTVTSLYPQISLPIDGSIIKKDIKYKVQMTAIAYDNEKQTLHTSVMSDEFSLTGDFIPTVYFNDTILLYDGGGNITGTKSGIDYNKIEGSLTIDTENSDILIDHLHPLTYEMTAPLLYYVNQSYDNLPVENNIITIPILNRGLMQNTSYSFRVWGYLDVDGDDVYTKQLVGSCTVKTLNKTGRMSIQMSEAPGNYVFAVNLNITADPVDTYLENSIGVMELSLYDADTKELIETKRIFDSEFDTQEEDYTLIDGHTILVTEETFGYTGAAKTVLTDSSYIVEVTSLSDYSYQRKVNSEPELLPNFQANNLVEYTDAGVSKSRIPVNTKFPPPALPEIQEGEEEGDWAVLIKAVQNSELAAMMGNVIYYQEQLLPETRVGVILEANYSNSSALLRKVHYYTFLLENYKTRPFSEGARDPIEDNAIEKIKLSSVTVTRNDTTTPKVMFLYGNPPAGQGEEGSISLNGETVPYKYLGDSYVRGKDMVFAYTADLNPLGTSNPTDVIADYYPYHMNPGYSSGYVLYRIFKPAKQEPVMYAYQESSNDTVSNWKVQVSDPDQTITAGAKWQVSRVAVEQSEISLDTGFQSVTYRGMTNNDHYQVSLFYRSRESEEEDTSLPLINIQRKLLYSPTDDVTIKVYPPTSNYLRLELTGTGGAASLLHRAAGLKLVLNADGIEEPATFYLTLDGDASNSGETTLNASMLISLMPKSWEDKQVHINDETALLYDSENNGIQTDTDRDSSLFAMQRVAKTGSLENYITMNSEKSEFITTTSAMGSIFRLTDFTGANTEYSVKAINLCADYIGNEKLLNLTLTSQGFQEAAYSNSQEEDGWLAFKMLESKEVIIDTENKTFTLPAITPSISKVNEWDMSLINADNKFRVSGLSSGNKLYFLVHKGELSEGAMQYNTLIPPSENDLLDEIHESYYRGVTVSEEGFVEITLDNLEASTNYQIQAYYWKNGSLARVLDASGDSEYQEVIQTAREINITNLRTEYFVSSYNNRYINLSYQLNYLLGFKMRYDIEVYDGSKWLDYYHYEDMLAENCITVDSTYSSDNTKSFYMYPGGQLRPGGKYRLVLSAISNNDGEQVLSTEKIEFLIPRSPLPTFYVTATASVVTSGGETEHRLDITAHVNDAYKVITNGINEEGVPVMGEYMVRVIDSEGNDITPEVYKNQYFSSNQKQQMIVPGLRGSTSYRIVFYAVMDQAYSGPGDNGIKSIREVPLAELGNPKYIAGQAIEMTLNDYGVKMGTVSLRSRNESGYMIDLFNASGVDVINRVEYSISHMQDGILTNIIYQILEDEEVSFTSVGTDYYQLKLPCTNVATTGIHYITVKMMIDDESKTMGTYSFSSVY